MFQEIHLDTLENYNRSKNEDNLCRNKNLLLGFTTARETNKSEHIVQATSAGSNRIPNTVTFYVSKFPYCYLGYSE